MPALREEHSGGYGVLHRLPSGNEQVPGGTGYAPVAIPPRPKQNKPRPRTASKDEQISRLRMRTKRMAIAIGTLALLLVVSLTILFLSLREEEKLPTGRNFKTTASTGESTSSGK